MLSLEEFLKLPAEEKKRNAIWNYQKKIAFLPEQATGSLRIPWLLNTLI